ncbi:MAG: cytochrome c-type biogenesis protein, partial [Pseudomonadota bacterium]
MTLRSLLFALIWLFSIAAPLSAATLAEYKFDDPAQDQDFREIIEEMRCLVCQNESLAGSNAELAVDLRNEIYDMMQAGQTKDDIIRFMVDRYGDFVLYNPPMKPSTYPLWFGPLFLFLIGALLLLRT